MSAIPPIAPVQAEAIAPLVLDRLGVATLPTGPSFQSLLTDGLKQMEGKVAKADELVRRFAIDDSIPVHQVTYALEEARLSVELAMQVRSRLVEAYRDLMNMQL